jgi:hypothetical protein
MAVAPGRSTAICPMACRALPELSAVWWAWGVVVVLVLVLVLVFMSDPLKMHLM